MYGSCLRQHAAAALLALACTLKPLQTCSASPFSRSVKTTDRANRYCKWTRTSHAAPLAHAAHPAHKTIAYRARMLGLPPLLSPSPLQEPRTPRRQKNPRRFSQNSSDLCSFFRPLPPSPLLCLSAFRFLSVLCFCKWNLLDFHTLTSLLRILTSRAAVLFPIGSSVSCAAPHSHVSFE